MSATAGDAPRAEITNGLVTARFYLPDAERGHYRGTRFDRSGDTYSLRFAGHEFTGPWFESYDPLRHDALMGPVEEFLSGDSSPGYAEAKVGEGFVRIGVGVVRKTEDKPYERFRTYEIIEPGKWTITAERDRIVFEHALEGPAGYAYVYRKTIALLPGQAVMTIAHSLRNVGKRPIETEQYNHNFFVLDQAATGPDTSVRFAFDPQGTTDRGLGQLALLRGRELVFPNELPPKESVFTELTRVREHSRALRHPRREPQGRHRRAHPGRPAAREAGVLVDPHHRVPRTVRQAARRARAGAGLDAALRALRARQTPSRPRSFTMTTATATPLSTSSRSTRSARSRSTPCRRPTPATRASRSAPRRSATRSSRARCATARRTLRGPTATASCCRPATARRCSTACCT